MSSVPVFFPVALPVDVLQIAGETLMARSPESTDMSFLDDGYLLETAAARDLYQSIADLPVVDPHNHIDLAEVVENEHWADIWEVEGATDHYVWQPMRKRGVPETKITGDASNREKWTALAEVFPDLAGNPTYEWVHLDLKRRFGIEKTINAETADGSGRRRKHSYSPTRCGPNRSSGTWTWRCCAAATTRPTGWSTTNAPKTRSRAWTSVLPGDPTGR